MGVGHTFRLDAGRACSSADGQPGTTGPRPVLRRRGPGAHRLPGVRRVHDRLPAQRQEHAAQELPRPRRGGRRHRAPDDHRDQVVRPRPQGGYDVETVQHRDRCGTRAVRSPPTRSCSPRGTYDTQKLLHRMKDEGSCRALRAAGPAVAHQLRVDRGRHRAPQRRRLHAGRRDHLVVPPRRAHPHRAGALRQGQQRDGHARHDPHRRRGGHRRAGRCGCSDMAKNPGDAVRSLSVRHWSEKGVIALVMQTVDNSITVHTAKSRLGRWKLTSRQGDGEPNPTWIPAANDAVRRIAEKIDGFPMGQLGELLDVPMTAHFIGGCVHRRRPGARRDRRLPARLRPRRACTSSTARRSPPTSA